MPQGHDVEEELHLCVNPPQTEARRSGRPVVGTKVACEHIQSRSSVIGTLSSVLVGLSFVLWGNLCIGAARMNDEATDRTENTISGRPLAKPDSL